MSLIGISGKIGSGKDTVGKIIQSIINGDHKEGTLKVIQNNYSIPDSNWEIKKFADKLKDIFCLLIGFTREELESHDFKNKELGEEWWYYKVYTSGNIYSYLEYKDMLPSPEYYLEKHTPRTLMQLLGTECGRQIIHPNIWVNSLMSDYKPLCESRCNPEQCTCEEDCIGKKSNWLITDMRFPNELQAIKDKGGIVLRINRNNATSKGIDLHQKLEYEITGKGNHISETALDNSIFDYVIENNGTLEELILEVEKFLKFYKII